MGHLQTTIIVNKETKSCLHTSTLHSVEHGGHKYSLHETPQNKTSIQSCNDVTTSSSFSIIGLLKKAKISIGTNCFQ